ncbi:hypothetical protein M2310_003769 [Rhizobium leguminosarum]|nr:hypothetical protein [Rhizobium leguminosarum]
MPGRSVTQASRRFLFNALHGVVNQPGIGETPSARAELLRVIEVHFLRALGLPSGID